jgi:tetratricopeptide (TPR) repeat protein
MEREEAIRFLLEDCLFPAPLTYRGAEEIWESRRAIAESRGLEEDPFTPRKIPLSDADLKTARRFRSRHPDAESVVDFVRLNPMDLVIHQLWISTAIAGGFRDRVTPDKWFLTALLDPPMNSRLKWRREGNTIIVDLPHFEFFLAGPLQPDGHMLVSEADAFVTVALHADRALLLRGYHRTFACAQGLLDAANAPGGVLFGESNSLAMMGSDADEILRMMEGPRPPRLGDFFDDRLFLPVTLRRRQYQMRIDHETIEIEEEEPEAADLENRLPAQAAQNTRKPVAQQNVKGMFDVAMRYQRAGRIRDAVGLYERIILLKPDYADAHNNMGVALLAYGRIADAIACFEHALAIDADNADFHRNIGMALVEQGRIDDAVVHYERSLVRDPENAATHINLSVAFQRQGRAHEAVASAERAFVLDPDNADGLNNLGYALAQQDRVEEAIPYYGRALAINPHHLPALINLGNIFKFQGKFDDAEAQYGRALKMAPDSAEAHLNRAEIKSFHPGDPDLAALEALAGRDDLPISKTLQIHFALAKALEDCGEYARAFEHLRKGNDLKRRQIHYDGEPVARMFQPVAAVFDSNLFNRFEGGGDPSSVPVFVLGMPRSGTSLVEQILASHPRIYGAGELTDLDMAERTVLSESGESLRYPEYVPFLDASMLRRMGQAYLGRLPAVADGQVRIVDKIPGNFLKIGLIRLILPNARIIHTLRDPIDTCVSCYSRLFDSGQPFSYDLAELGRYYRLYAELMAHWRAVLPAGAMLEVSYEDVVDDLEGQARRLIAYCGLPWDDRCLDFHRTRRLVKTASTVQVRKPLFRDSLERWRKYEAGLGPLLRELGDLSLLSREYPIASRSD